MELLSPISGGWVPAPLLVSSWLMVLVLGAVGYGLSRRLPPGAIQPAMVGAGSGTATRPGHPSPTVVPTGFLLPLGFLRPTGFLLPLGFLFPAGLTPAGREHRAGSTRLPPSGDVEYAIDRSWSPGARLGVWYQPPRRVVTGHRAHIRWWHRVRSVALLTAFVVVGGVATATAIGITLFLSGFLVEQAIG
ncbi:MAG: hypothetical protein MK182_07310 [Acidimicrobiales bacterium]|nr:hypothetical protein [Acidimicrobiales bacterium]